MERGHGPGCRRRIRRQHFSTQRLRRRPGLWLVRSGRRRHLVRRTRSRPSLAATVGGGRLRLRSLRLRRIGLRIPASAMSGLRGIPGDGHRIAAAVGPIFGGFGWGWAPGAACGGLGWGFFGGGQPVNIGAAPVGYRPIRVPVSGPHPIRPVLPVRTFQPTGPSRPVQYTQRQIAGKTVAAITPGRNSFVPSGGTAGSSLRRDFPVDSSTHAPVLGLASTTPAAVHTARGLRPASAVPASPAQPPAAAQGSYGGPSRVEPTVRPEPSSPAVVQRPTPPPAPVQRSTPPPAPVQRYSPPPSPPHPTYTPPPPSRPTYSPPPPPPASHPSYSPPPASSGRPR